MCLRTRRVYAVHRGSSARSLGDQGSPIGAVDGRVRTSLCARPVPTPRHGLLSARLDHGRLQRGVKLCQVLYQGLEPLRFGQMRDKVRIAHGSRCLRNVGYARAPGPDYLLRSMRTTHQTAMAISFFNPKREPPAHCIARCMEGALPTNLNR